MKSDRDRKLQRFTGAFCQWAIDAGYPTATRRRIPNALRKAVLQELPSRDNHEYAVFRTLEGSEGLNCHYLAADLVLLPAAEGSKSDRLLIAGTTCPSWRGGWNDIDRDADIGDMFWHFFYAVRTYIVRSRLLRCTAALALTDGRATDFRYGDKMWELELGSDRHSHPTFASATDHLISEGHLAALHQPRASQKLRELHGWLSRLNPMDPFIHRMLYQYVRASRLRQYDLYEDALTALDSVVDVSAQFVQDRFGAKSNQRRHDLVTVLALSAAEDKHLGQLFALRSYFGAHPSESGWWDVRDNFSESIDKMFTVVRRLIRRVAEAESADRRVEPAPRTWSEWFLEHADLISPPVWLKFDGPAWVPLSKS